jgi:hypothetical protein
MPRWLFLLWFFLLFFVSSVATAQIAMTPPTVVASRNPPYRPHLSAASSGRSFFVTWEERLFEAWPQTSKGVYRAYDSIGIPQQALPLPLPGRNSPSVVWNGSDWFVAWADYLSRFQQFPAPMIKGSRFTERGEMIDTAPITLVNSFGTTNVKVVWNGTTYLVGGSRSVLAARDGQVLRTLDVDYWPLASAAGTFLVLGDGVVQILSGDGTALANVPIERGGRLAAAANGDEYGLISVFTDSIKMLTISTRGEVTTRYSEPITPGIWAADLTWSGDSYLLSWSDSKTSISNSDHHLCFSRFTRSSTPRVDCRDTAGIVRSIALAAGNEKTLISWIERINDVDRVFTAFVAPTGMPNLTGATTASVGIQPQNAPAIEIDPSGYTVVWSEPDDLPRAMLGGVDASFVPRPVRSLAAPAPTPVRLARGRDATLAVWSSEGDAPRIYAQRIADSGGIAAPILLGSGRTPAVAFDAENWLVVWESATDIPLVMSTLVSASGISLQPGGSPLSPTDARQSHPAVASRGTDFLVAWIESPPAARPQLRAVGIGRAGQPTGDAMTLADSQYFTALDVAAGDGQYLLVVGTLEGNIGLPITSTISGILVAGAPAPFRVRPRAGSGFLILAGSPPHVIVIDRDANAFEGGTLPIKATSFDFVVDGDRLIVAYAFDRAYVQTFGGRQRAVRHR